MRVWNAPSRADIIVSELLGSFGDNELSPECLDGANSFLHPTSLSIPSKYESFLAPISSPRLWSDVNQMKTLQAFETPYVVRIHNAYVAAQPESCFMFEHPNLDPSSSKNDRHVRLSWFVSEDTTVHGFAGYFDATLYKRVNISILPKTFSKGMFSWFPIFFPLRTPITMKAGESMEAQMWRCSSTTKVWYEWCVTSPVVTPIHNPGGRSYSVGLQ